jgi:hypothetical protein
MVKSSSDGLAEELANVLQQAVKSAVLPNDKFVSDSVRAVRATHNMY